MGGLGYVLADTIDYGPDEVIFEAGSGSESTPYLRQCGTVHTVDITAGLDAEHVLRDWPVDGVQIKFAYLDSWDWPYPNMNQAYLTALRRMYAARGEDLSEDASAAHHLALVRLLALRCPPGAVIAIDDTWATRTGFDGKGRDAIPHLLDHGWTLYGRHTEPWSGPHRSGRNRFYVAVRR